MTSFDEVKELHELNVELLETLLIIGKRFLDYKKQYHLQIEGMDSLTRLISKAQGIMEEIGWPYKGKPVISDARYHNHSNDSSDDKETQPLAWVLLSCDKSEALR